MKKHLTQDQPSTCRDFTDCNVATLNSSRWRHIAKALAIAACLLVCVFAVRECSKQPVEPTVSSEPSLGTTIRVPGIELDMMPIPAGSFLMGSAPDEPGNESNEPQRHTIIPKPFWLGKYPVTQKQWGIVMGSDLSYFKGANRPVEQVNWQEARTFCKRLNDQERASGRLPTGYEYTLPTEAQWEYACRAGTTGATYNKKEDFKILGKHNAPALDAIAWYGGNCSVNFDASGGSSDISYLPEKQYYGAKGGTHNVGEKAANDYGLHDMIGNVFEWCLDERVEIRTVPNNDDTLPAGSMDTYLSSVRPIRGGSYISGAKECRAAHYFSVKPDICYPTIGFRLALTPID